jgi:integrase
MPHRVSEHGSFRFDVVFPEIGRIALASGAQSKVEHGKRVAMLHELYDNGQWDVLRDLKDRRFSPRQLWAYYKTGKVGQLGAEVVLRQPLKATVEVFLPVSAKAAATRARYEVSWHSLERAGVLPPDAIVRDLERVNWIQMQQTWPGGPYDWKHLRGFVSRFLSALLRDRWHAFRRGILDPQNFPPAPEPEGRVPDLTVAAFWKAVEAMPEHTKAVPVAIVATGFRIGELCACQETDLRPLTMGICVPGQDLQTGRFKSQEAVIPIDERLWDWVRAAIPCPVSHWSVRAHWTAACTAAGITDVTLHDLRHCHGQWLINAGRSEEAVQRGLRHKTAAMTRRYVRQRDRQGNAAAIADVLMKSHSTSHGAKKRKGRKRA